MTEYFVSWEINVSADSPLEAAQLAKEYQQHASTFLVFEDGVDEATTINLDDPE